MSVKAEVWCEGDSEIHVVIGGGYVFPAADPGAAEGAAFAGSLLPGRFHKGDDLGFRGVYLESPFACVVGDYVEHQLQFPRVACQEDDVVSVHKRPHPDRVVGEAVAQGDAKSTAAELL